MRPPSPPPGWSAEFVDGLIAEFPGLRSAYEEHIKANFGELLAHLLMGDVVRFLEAKHTERDDEPANMRLIKSIMDYIGRCFETASPWVKELIAVSFVENMPYPDEVAADIVGLLPENLKAELAVQRG
ncbi:MAG: hypothetical protein Q8R02_16905 [Hyphomonadaceae bacterium]|nr:hypothetical protein [Hyphomonadaceae bacterium]